MTIRQRRNGKTRLLLLGQPTSTSKHHRSTSNIDSIEFDPSKELHHQQLQYAVLHPQHHRRNDRSSVRIPRVLSGLTLTLSASVYPRAASTMTTHDPTYHAPSHRWHRQHKKQLLRFQLSLPESHRHIRESQNPFFPSHGSSGLDQHRRYRRHPQVCWKQACLASCLSHFTKDFRPERSEKLSRSLTRSLAPRASGRGRLNHPQQPCLQTKHEPHRPTQSDLAS